MAIWPAGPPKLTRPRCSQKRAASGRLTELVGTGVEGTGGVRTGAAIGVEGVVGEL